ncbi:signal recognition particle-docking protein FtsY [Natronolimnohabitans innermongolicus]|uniref:Signal recognition particle receptor FtsY n=1 Tax=Natronolimnohabitans innermongolicus JCM 12255 TaxID=1227499 RepID=L9X2B0_9EURY|nr:signal recognition particle-docking protein FtsY [Natronolimnohabitans innermongolicus]ELY55899.1 cell division protein FtsY [Natronolimnohabitans innermongolicus JCM 12255]
MFDNLKKKLGSFRKDAEEAAEENVEAVEDEELDDADAEVADASADVAESDADSEFESDSEPEPEPDADSEAESVPEASADADGTDAASAPTPEAPDTTGKTAASGADDEPAEGGLEAGTTAPTESERGTEPEAETAAAEPESETKSEPDTEPEPEPEAADSGGLDLEGMIEREKAAEATASETAESAADAPADETAEAPEADTDDEAGTGIGTKARSLVKGKFVIEEEDLEGPLHELEMALLSSDVEMGVAEEILDNIRDELVGETRTFTTSTGEVVEDALADAIYDVISVGQFDFDERIAEAEKPVTIVFTGVNGVGKTTSIAKLSRYFEERGYSSVMANGDTYRAGANEQIEEHAEALDTKLITHEQGGDPAAVLYDGVEYAEANDIDIVLGDTAGRLHTDEGLMDQLEKIDRVVDPDMTLFVDEAVAGQDAVNRAREFNDAAETDGAILTKADADSNGGAAISIAHVTGKPILFLGVGQGYDDIEPFDPDEMVDRLLRSNEE